MSQLLAIEWDAHEVRLVSGRTRGKDLTIEHAFAVKLPDRQEEVSAESVGELVKQELRLRGIGRAETLVAVGRANIELKQLNLPPAPEEELPEMVRFQALRQFTTIGEDWPLDFVPLTAGEGDSVNVLAAAIAPDLIEHIRKTCEKAELVAKRLVLRPFAAASLLRRNDRGASQPCRLMVDLLAEEADLTVLDGEFLLLTRTVRVQTGDAGEVNARWLLGEIRRTIAAANNQLGARRVEQVILCGDGDDHATLKSLIEQDLSLTTELFDPFADFRRAGQLKLPEHSSRFAPLLGLLHDEASGAKHLIDFLHPRKKREKTDIRRRNRLIAATLATVCFGSFFLIWMWLDSLDSQIADLESESARLKRSVSEAEALRKDETAVQNFIDKNINLLDELRTLSEKMPPPEDAIVTELAYLLEVDAGRLKIDGFTREPTGFQDIEKRLRTANREVKSDSKQNDEKREKHKYGFSEVIKIPAGESPSAKDTKKPTPTSVEVKQAPLNTATPAKGSK